MNKLELNRDLRITGVVINSNVSHPKPSVSTGIQIYSLTIYPEDPSIIYDLSLNVYEQVGNSDCGTILAKDIASSEKFCLESLNKPMVTGLTTGDEFQEHSFVTVSCRFEVEYSVINDQYYLRSYLRGVDLADDHYETLPHNDHTDFQPKYADFNF